MNTRELAKMGICGDCIGVAITAIQRASASGRRDAKVTIPKVMSNPEHYFEDIEYGDFAKAIAADRDFVRPAPISYKVWGGPIDDASREQMENVCSLPMAVKAAVMPDFHMGYGGPIGGVVALENAVVPFLVGVDIACRMKMSIFDIKPELLDKSEQFKVALQKGTNFGVGCEYNPRKSHEVMDEDWDVTPITKRLKDKAWSQLGTSGSGNHFAEFGILTDLTTNEKNVALMTHSGSRGTGSAVCDAYSTVAKSRLSSKFADLGNLAWLDLDTEAGQEYWAAMELMGMYAAANHDIIHRGIAKLLHVSIMRSIENHHNFAWKEQHLGREVIVHRKGATPAGKGVLGVIPGSMGTPAYVVEGLGNPDSLCSASHGAGRCMSRRKAKDKYTWAAVRNHLAKQGIIVMSAGADEVPYAYKDIEVVMAAQTDLVKSIMRFDPKIVKMSDDGKSED